MQETRNDVGAAVHVGRVEAALTPLAMSGLGLGRQRRTRVWKTRRVVLVLWDALGWLLALSLAAALRYEFVLADVHPGELLTIFLVAVAGQLVVGGILQTYRGRHGVGSVEDAINVAGAAALVGALTFLVVFFVQPALLMRSIPLLATPIMVLLAVGSRLVFRLYREHRYRPDYTGAERVIIYGAGLEGQQLMRLMLSDPSGSFLPVALLDDNRFFRRRRISGVGVHGTRADIAAAAMRSCADMVVIADPSLPDPVVREVATAAQAAGLRVSRVPPLAELLRPLPAVQSLPAPLPAPGELVADPERRDGEVAVISGVVARPAASWAKRALDVLLCLGAAVVLLPLLALIAVALKVSTGEVIYRAPRIGLGGRPFTMFKFSTMAPGDGGPRITREGDPRITPIGRFLRASKLNELPQIFNVIKGDMSVVGPRPEDPLYTARYSDRQRLVLGARPGMTSLAYLRFGDEQAFIERAGPNDIEAFYVQELLPEKLAIELDYIRTWSLVQDVQIIARTVRELLR